MCARMCIVHVSVCTCVYKCKHVCVCIDVSICACVYISVSMCMCIGVNICACVYISVNVCGVYRGKHYVYVSMCVYEQV